MALPPRKSVVVAPMSSTSRSCSRPPLAAVDSCRVDAESVTIVCSYLSFFSTTTSIASPEQTHQTQTQFQRARADERASQCHSVPAIALHVSTRSKRGKDATCHDHRWELHMQPLYTSLGQYRKESEGRGNLAPESA
eukprot:1944080-Rhodomonas_salina.1